MAKDESRIPTGRVRRTAKVGIGDRRRRARATRARARANVVRSKERREEALEQTHLEAAERMVDDARAR